MKAFLLAMIAIFGEVFAYWSYRVVIAGVYPSVTEMFGYGFWHLIIEGAIIFAASYILFKVEW